MSDNVKAILAIVAAMLAFSVSDILIKIVGSVMPLGQVLALRGLMAMVLITAYAAATGALARLDTIADLKVLWRSLAETACSLLYFIALLAMTIADAAAVSQVAPMAVMAAAALFLGEKIGWRRWSAAGVSLIGVLLIIKPGTSAFQPAALIMMGSNLFIVVRDLITRRLDRAAPTVLVTGAATAAVTVMGLAMMPFSAWYTPSYQQLAMLALSGTLVFVGFMLAILAMRIGDLGLVSPFRYSFMLFATIAGAIVFGAWPDRWSMGGIALILGSGLYMLHRERVVGRERAATRTAAPPSP